MSNFFADEPGFSFEAAAPRTGPVCFIHIGTRKTSTTSIQLVLKKRPLELQAAGLGYLHGLELNQFELALAAGARPRMEEYGFIFGDRFDEIEAGAMVKCQAALDDWSARGGDRDLILSCEDLSKIERPHIEALKRLLSGRFDAIKVVCILRRQVDYAVSNLSTLARVGFGPDTLQSNFSLESDRYYRLDYQAMLADWAAVFGREAMIVETFDAACAAPGGPVRRFFDMIGASRLELPADPPKANRGLPATAVGMMLSLNQTGFGLEREGVGPLRYRMLALVKSEAKGPPWRPDPALAQVYEDRFDQSNAQVARDYFPQRPGQPLFPPRPPAPAGPPIEILSPAMSELTAKVLARAITQA